MKSNTKKRLIAFMLCMVLVLSSATSGYHYHLIEASSEERLDLIRDQLEKAGFLAPLQPWEQHTEKGNIKL